MLSLLLLYCELIPCGLVNGNRDRPHSVIQSYLDDTSDSALPRRLAEQSRLPNSDSYRTHDYHGRPKGSIGTSMLLSGSDHTRTSTSEDLAALTRTSSLTYSESESSSIGIRQLGSQRILSQGPDGELVVPPVTRTPILECPFNLLFCFMAFSSLDEWINHSLSHFQNINPSTSNVCCFCEAIFRNQNGKSSWKERMHHVAMHHHLGHKLAHAQPDFQLFQYLWQNRLITSADYRELKGNSRNRAHAAATYPSPPVLQNRGNATYTETNIRRSRPNA